MSGLGGLHVDQVLVGVNRPAHSSRGVGGLPARRSSLLLMVLDPCLCVLIRGPLALPLVVEDEPLELGFGTEVHQEPDFDPRGPKIVHQLCLMRALNCTCSLEFDNDRIANQKVRPEVAHRLSAKVDRNRGLLLHRQPLLPQRNCH